MADRTINILSICTGGAGLDRGVHLALAGLGFTPRTVCYVEREAFACSVLATEMAAGRLDEAPLWTDLRTFDGKPWRGVVDLVIGGIPCQGNSLAGSRKLADDHRDLWSDTARILREIQPRRLLIENVFGLLVPDRKGGREAPIRRMLRELAEMGWDAEWCVLPASAVGASHRRERVFVLADFRDDEIGIGARAEGWQAGQWVTERGELGRDHDAVGHAERTRRDERGSERGKLQQHETRGAVLGERSEGLGHARRELPQGIDQAGAAGGAVRRASRGGLRPILFAPGPTDPRWPDILNAAPSLEPAVCELADGLAATRRDWLRLLGNGVVPLQAAAAIRGLWDALDRGGD